MPQITDELREEVFRRKGRACSYWNKNAKTCERLATEIDHYFPQKYGGPTRLDNLEPVCSRCNTQKGDTVPHPDPRHHAHRWWIEGHPMNDRCRRYYKLQ